MITVMATASTPSHRIASVLSVAPMETVEAWTLAVSEDDTLLASGTQKGCVNLWALEGHKKASVRGPLGRSRGG